MGIASNTASVSSEAGTIDAVMEVAVVGTSGSCAARDTRWTDRMQQYDRGRQQEGGNGLVHGCQGDRHHEQKCRDAEQILTRRKAAQRHQGSA
jgi:hypothetical protein